MAFHGRHTNRFLSADGWKAFVNGMQIEGRGNGIKTNIVNNVDIAKALERPPECESSVHHLCGTLSRFEGCISMEQRACHGIAVVGPLDEMDHDWCLLHDTDRVPLSALTFADVLKYFGVELGALTNYDKSSGISIVNGAHDARKLSEVLEGFIKKFVQCYSCGNPETVIKIRKELLHLKCKACGFVSDVDPRHKLNTCALATCVCDGVDILRSLGAMRCLASAPNFRDLQL
jgi:translation initiation factor 2 beta subunit (eIF-2beta)/eIF-5